MKKLNTSKSAIIDINDIKNDKKHLAKWFYERYKKSLHFNFSFEKIIKLNMKVKKMTPPWKDSWNISQAKQFAKDFYLWGAIV